MPKYEIRYYEIQSDHILAMPEFHHKEVVEAKFYNEALAYIRKQKDGYGHKYRLATDEEHKMFGFDFHSAAGAVKIRKYKPRKVKQI